MLLNSPWSIFKSFPSKCHQKIAKQQETSEGSTHVSPLSDSELVTSAVVVPSFDGYHLCPEIKAEFHEQNNPPPSPLLQMCPLLGLLAFPLTLPPLASSNSVWGWSPRWCLCGLTGSWCSPLFSGSRVVDHVTEEKFESQPVRRVGLCWEEI